MSVPIEEVILAACEDLPEGLRVWWGRKSHPESKELFTTFCDMDKHPIGSRERCDLVPKVIADMQRAVCQYWEPQS